MPIDDITDGSDYDSGAETEHRETEAEAKDREHKESAANCKADGLSPTDAKANGHDAKDMKEGGYNANECKDAGFSAIECKEAGFNANECKDAGFNAIECKDAGFNAIECKDAGFNARECKEAGFNANECKDAGFSAHECKDAGFDARDCKDAGFNAHECKDAGFNATECKDAGFNASQCKEAGFEVPQMKEAGFNSLQMYEAGFTASQLRGGGYSDSQQIADFLNSPKTQEIMKSLMAHQKRQVQELIEKIGWKGLAAAGKVAGNLVSGPVGVAINGVIRILEPSTAHAPTLENNQNLNINNPSLPTNNEVSKEADKLIKSGNVTFSNNHVSGIQDNATAQKNIDSLRTNQPVFTSEYGHAKGQVVKCDKSLLSGLNELSQNHRFNVSELVGGDHTKPTSDHYKCKAIDINFIDGKHVGSDINSDNRFIENARNAGFKVRHEGNHIHISI